MRRALLLLAAAAVSLAATFGGPEEIDPQAAPAEVGYGEIARLGVDGNGRAYWLAERGAKAVVLERCAGGWQTAFQDGENALTQDLAVAPSGAAVAVWFEDSEQVLKTAYRAPGGTWGAP